MLLLETAGGVAVGGRVVAGEGTEVTSVLAEAVGGGLDFDGGVVEVWGGGGGVGSGVVGNDEVDIGAVG